MTPLWVRPGADDSWQLVTGFRRYAAARELGVERLPARVLRGGPEESLRVALHEGVGTRPFSPAEQVRVVAKFRRLADYDDERLAREVLPLLGLPASRQVLRRLLQVAELPEYVLEAVEQGLNFEVAASLARRPEPERRFLVDLLLRRRLGANKQRELVRLLDDLARLRNRPLEQLWKDLGLQELEADPELSPADRYRRLRKHLQERRFPVRSAHEARLRELLASLDLPPGVEVIVPPDFEGDHLTVRLTAASSQALRELVEALEKVRNRDTWDELFKLL
ncbi:MAG: hypothetical protein Kow00109_26910 [Acidobacteriota bacterium]